MRDIERNGFPAEHYLTNLTVASFMLVPIGYFLLPLYVSLVGGDMVAKEAEDGTLRMILSRPITRLRLLLLKWLAGAIFSFVLVLTLGLFGALFASIFFPLPAACSWCCRWTASSAPLKARRPGNASPSCILFMTAEACSMMSLAFMFSCFNIKPAAATILAISFFFISMILHNMPYFQD